MEGTPVPYQKANSARSHRNDRMRLKLTALPSGTPSAFVSDDSSSPSGISVDLFKQILFKSAKRANLNVDEIVEELDPYATGVIRLSSIHSFGNAQLIEKQKSGIDDIGGHHENTVVLKSPNVS